MIEGVEKIKSKMLLQAGSESEKIISEAKKEAAEIKASNKKKIDSFLSSEKEKIKAEASLLTDRELASAQMESRKEYMEERESAIDKIIDYALSNINSAKNYSSFLEKNLKEYAKLMGHGFKIECNKKDIDLVKKIVAKLKVDAKVVEGNLRAGLILVGKETRINLSIESVLEEKRREIRKKIVEVLGA